MDHRIRAAVDSGGTVRPNAQGIEVGLAQSANRATPVECLLGN